MSHLAVPTAIRSCLSVELEGVLGSATVEKRAELPARARRRSGKAAPERYGKMASLSS
jgi:hypothetical protein